MYIIAAGWLYVTLLMALTESSVVGGVLSFALYGVAPVWLLAWLFGTPARRQRRIRRETAERARAAGDSDKPEA